MASVLWGAIGVTFTKHHKMHLFSNFGLPSEEECTEELKNALIANFETAMAIATVLEWVSDEMHPAQIELNPRNR